MRVELDPSVFNGRWDLELLGIFALGIDGRHRIRAPEPTLAAWSPMQNHDVSDTIRLVVDQAIEKEALGRPVDTLVVSTSPVAWGPTMTLPPHKAFLLLARPLRVILENGWTDRNFLLAFADADARETLEDAEREGWLHFESGGGIAGVLSRLEDVQGRPEHAARVFAICDSDRRGPGELRDPARTLRRIARQMARNMNIQAQDWLAHVLERRAAENYVPSGPLLAYARQQFGSDAVDALRDHDRGRAALIHSAGGRGTPRRLTLASRLLRDLPDDVFAYLDMREGRGGEAHPRTDEPIWARLDTVQQVVLLDGFGPQYIAGFYEQARALPDDSGEIARILDTIRRRC